MLFPESTPTSYRRDIDGLRAIAVLSVMAFHFFPNSLPGGFAGVDIFFVISGFLITGIVIKELEAERFSIVHFYVRRIRRIFPALLIVLLVALAAGWFVLLPSEYGQLGRHVAAGAGFVSNLVLWSESGYFDNIAATKPLLNLWSLGVEEQFYILWPVLLWAAFRKKISVLAVLALVIFLSFASNVHHVVADRTAAFYSPISRFWELGLGALLSQLPRLRALVFSRFPTAFSWLGTPGAQHATAGGAFAANVCSVAGITLIAATFALLTEAAKFPGWWATLPVLGAFLVIGAGPMAWVNRILLSGRLVVWVGLISYPLYLWHWPLLSFARIFTPGSLGTGTLLLLAAASVLLAWLTYVLVEKPIRRGGFDKQNALVLAAVMAVVGCAGWIVYKLEGLPSRFPVKLELTIKELLKTNSTYRANGCHIQFDSGGREYPDRAACVFGSKRPLVFLLGDSHAQSLYPGVKYLQDKVLLSVAQFTANSCPPLLGWSGPGNPICEKINRDNFAYIKQMQPDVVLLHANWPSKEHYPLENLGATVVELKTMGIRKIVVLGPVPQWEISLPRSILRYMTRNFSLSGFPGEMKFGLDPEIKMLDSRMRQEVAAMGVKYVSAYDLFCKNDGCMTRLGAMGSSLTTYDYGHISVDGSVFLAEKILPELLN